MVYKLDFDKIRQLFGGKLTQSQVDGINDIVNTFNQYGDGQKDHLAYILATAKHETWNTMQPIAEVGHGKGHVYGVPDEAGKAPYGRGYVQLTFRVNYVKLDNYLKLGGALAGNYDLAMQPDIAARILVEGMILGLFSGVRLSQFKTFYSMRKVVNGTDKAQLIANYANQFLGAIQ